MYAGLIRTKKCSSCCENKEASEFYKRTLSPDGLAYICKICDNTLHKEYFVKNADKVRAQRKDFRLRNKSRLSIAKNRAKCSPEEFTRLFSVQEGKCAICGTHQSEMRRRIAVDHCHKTNRIRGLLCDNCNRCLGLLKDSKEFLMLAFNYLLKYEK